MIIRFERTLTAAQLLDELREKYGGGDELRRRVKRNPRDVLAQQDLEDFEYYSRHPDKMDEKVTQSISLFPTNEAALAVLTPERLRLLEVLSRKGFSSIRELASFLRRDVHNVHDDLQKFHALDVVQFERGRRNSRIPRLMADTITIVPDEAVAVAKTQRPGENPHRRERQPASKGDNP